MARHWFGSSWTPARVKPGDLPSVPAGCWPARPVAKGDGVRALHEGGPEPHGTRLAWGRGDRASVPAKPVTAKASMGEQAEQLLETLGKLAAQLASGHNFTFHHTTTTIPSAEK